MTDIAETIHNCSLAVAALSFSTENEQLSQYKTEIAGLDAAIDRGTTAPIAAHPKTTVALSARNFHPLNR